MIDELSVSRRTVLAIGVAGAGAAALAACSSGSKGGGSADSPVNAGQSSGPADSGSASGPTQTTGSAGASSSAQGGPALAKLDDIAVGQAVSAKLADGKPAIIARPTADTVAAFSAKCTHMGCTVQPAGNELHCPCHGSVYNAVTGQVLHGPAPEPLPKIAVHVANGDVVAG